MAIQAFVSDDSVVQEFDDSAWDSISLPHSWDVNDGQSGGDYYYGQSSYRKVLNVENIEKGKRYYIEFEGASLVATVYINGNKLGQHSGAWTAFRFDVTDYLQQGENIIAVQVDNRLSAKTPEDNFGREVFAPLDAGADFTWWGGIYRDVNLIKVNNVSIDAEDFGGPGVYVSQKLVSNEYADLEISTHLRNKSESDFEGDLYVTILNAEGERVTTIKQEITLHPNNTKVELSNLRISNPHLWQGKRDPYLYTVYAQLVSKSKEVVDEVEQPLGLRSFEFDSKTGFSLNGESYPLRGVAMHQDYADVGWATTQEQRQKSLDLINEMGANTIRLAHYPHNQGTLSYSDKLGFVNWLEFPMINAVTNTPQYVSNVEHQLTEMVKQSYNHPSIAVWALANELADDSEATTSVVQHMNQFVHSLDGGSYRKTAQGVIKAIPYDSPLLKTTDIISYNRYDGWYTGVVTDFGKFMDGLVQANPGIIAGVSEYGAGVSPYFHTDAPQALDHSEEYSQYFHESYLKQINERPYLWATHVWNMFDFTATGRKEGDRKGINDKGLVTLDRNVRKDAFFFYKASWTTTPVVHIASKKQSDTCPATVTLQPNPTSLCDAGTSRDYVKVYSNLESLTLYVDGQEIGTKNQADNSDKVIYEWDNLGLSFGSHKVEVVGEQNGEKYSDSFDLLRVENTDNVVNSQVFSIYSPSGEAVTGAITHLPNNINLGKLKSGMSIPAGATVEIKGKGSDESLAVSVGDTVVVTAESGASREYLIEQSDILSYVRPISDSSTKGFVPAAIDNPHNLNDSDSSTFWGGMVYPNYVKLEINLQQVFYVDSVELQQSADLTTQYPGSQNFQIGTNNVDVDNVVHVTESAWDQPSQTWNIDYDGQYVRIVINSSTKEVPILGGQAYPPLAAFSDIIVYGGMVKSSSLNIDYKNHTIAFVASKTVAELISETVSVADSSSTFTISVVDSSDSQKSETDTIVIGDKMVVTRENNGYTFTETYTIN